MTGKLTQRIILFLSQHLDNLKKYKILYFINPVDRYILVCNKKCASTSLRRLFTRKSHPEIIFHIKYPLALKAWLEENDISDYKKILFCRNPYARFLSFYFDKIVKVSQTNRFPWAYTKFLIRIFTGKEYNPFIQAIKEKNHRVATHIFIDNLPKIFFKYNGYFRPQHYIYTYQGKQLLTFDHILKLENVDHDLFSSITGESLLHQNPTSANTSNYLTYLDEHSITRLNQEYREDFLQFGYEQL